ncbi:MAG: ATP-dependent DNA helicase RecG [Planctomycetes bacterium]|nr:ATP-dependent DNA helicase RecG [Planctomycetota bacterium]
MSEAARTDDRPAADVLATPVQYLRGVGPQRAELLERLGLRTARDVLFYFPRDYQDLSDLNTIDDLAENVLLRVRAEVLEVESRRGRNGRTVLGLLLKVGPATVNAVWFNQPFLRDRFAVGQQLLLIGKARFRGGVWQFSHPSTSIIEAEPDEDLPNMLPVYSLTEGLAQGHLRRIVRAAVELCLPVLEEVFPPLYLEQHALLPLQQALPQIHFPHDRDQLATARRRFVYQELFILQLALATRRRRQHDQSQAPPLETSAKIDARIRRLFPFELTEGQNQAIREICADLALPLPMNRLLQGDVGSGKTIVAMYAILLAIAHGYQAALMAPTEILARQHAATLGKLLSHSQVRWKLLTGGLPASQREAIRAGLRSGELDAVIGTHAMLHNDVEFSRLGVVVIDEQHKFGVRQREILRRAGVDPHYLVMTATPIPRSLAMTLFGDLEVTTLRDAPPGRQTVRTYLATAEQREKWWDFFRRKLRTGRQGYVIAPLVDAEQTVTSFDDDAEAPPAAAEQLFEALAHGPLSEFRVGLVHGRMSGAEKQAAMEKFRSGQTQVLVATTVIEVGVDVPNATLMTIEDGHCFGLSQLHQLRGRITRGTHPGYCCVFAEIKNDAARERLEALVNTTDGFALAEIDFKLRGPGDLLGTQQHGLPPLRIADLHEDGAILEEARQDAREMIAQDPGLAAPDHQRLRRQMLSRYGSVLELGDVG